MKGEGHTFKGGGGYTLRYEKESNLREKKKVHLRKVT